MPTVNYTTMNGRIVGENRNGVKSDYMSDPLGNTIGLLDESGTRTDTWTYWPYGEVRTHAGSSQTPFTWVGVLGYYSSGARSYVRARFMEPGLGRWATVDPLWPRQPSYRYANSRPVERSDRSGLLDSVDDAVNLALELCTGDILACKGINDQLPPCTASNPNYQACGSQITSPGCYANLSNWPEPRHQNRLPWPFCWLGAEYCCIDCQMRVCCAFGPGNSLPTRRRFPGPPLPPPVAPIPIGQPVPVPPGHSPIWQ